MRSLLLISLFVLEIFSGGISPLRSIAGQAVSPGEGGRNNPREERFLQHFMTPAVKEETARLPSAPQVQPPASVVSEPKKPLPTIPENYLSTAATMILVLSLLLGFLLVAAYLIRRYLLPQGLTKRGTPIRVLTRVNVTPKATIALVEVPGKVLVVGITSQTLTTLGELEKEDPGVLLQQRGTGTQAEILPTQKNAKILDEETVFSATLDHQTHALDRFREEQEENILKVTEEIQKKVSGLKKL